MITINSNSKAEGQNSWDNLTFTITLSQASSSTITVNWATSNGTASAGTDYRSGSGSVTFSPGQTVKTINVRVNGDTTVEPNETFFVTLSGPTGGAALGSPYVGTGTINNDD
jgi:hypothetical protein